MADPKGFLKFNREEMVSIDPLERIENFNEFHKSLAIEDRKNQASRCMNCGVPFCGYGQPINNRMVGCPLHNYIPEWNTLVYKGQFEDAYRRLTMVSPFPEFTGRVCPALCEKACTCSLNGDSVAVRDNELFIIENAFEKGYVKTNEILVKKDKSVLVVGSGPSGLAVANRLNILGYDVTVIEKSDRLGGLLMYGIPNMKLEKAVIDRRIKLMMDSGIEFKTSTDLLNYDVSSYDAVVLSTGSSVPRNLDIKGRELDGIMYAVDFLTDSTKKLLNKEVNDFAKDKNVVVIGGGDTGNDCVGTCIRQKAKNIIQLEVMPKPSIERTEDNPWPLFPNTFKVDYGAEEHIALNGCDQRMFSVTAKEFIGSKNVKQIKIVDTKFENGRITENGNERVIDADLVLLAMGFVGTDQTIASYLDIELNGRNNVKTNDYVTSKANIFACGDAKNGQSLVVTAIADGIDCANVVDKYLSK